MNQTEPNTANLYRTEHDPALDAARFARRGNENTPIIEMHRSAI